MEANGDVGAAADAGHELKAKLEASGDVEVAAQVGHVAAVMDEMLAAEVAVEDLDVAVTEAVAVAVKLRVGGKEEEAKAMEEVAVKLKKAKKVQVKAQVLKKKVAQKEAEVTLEEQNAEAAKEAAEVSLSLQAAGVSVEAVSDLASVVNKPDASVEELEEAAREQCVTMFSQPQLPCYWLMHAEL